MEIINYIDITKEILYHTFNKKTLDLTKYESDEDFIKLMTEQTFLPFLYELDKKKVWRKYYYQAYIINEKFDKIGNLIKHIFDENNIKHIFLKGFELKKHYPNAWLRQMGDIDILVEKKNHKNAVKQLISIGFQFVEEVEHDIALSYDGIIIEIHNLLLADKEEFSNYFKEPFNDAILVSGSTYTLNTNLNYLYLIAHYIKHIKMGSGLRELCDLYVYQKHYTIDYQYIESIFKKENKFNFYTFLNNLIENIFINQALSKDDIVIDFLSYSLRSGIHGYGENADYIVTRFNSSKENKFIYLLKRWFIPIKDMFNFYPWTKSIILLPIGYFLRFFYLIIKRRKECFRLINHNKTDFYKKIGL